MLTAPRRGRALRLPMDETKFVDSFNGKNNLCHVEACNVLRKNLVLDEHRHQVTSRQELHEHVEEGSVLEGSVQLDDPWTVGLGEDVTLRADVGQLVLFNLLIVSFIAPNTVEGRD
jgi:hypothetical protein